MGHEILTDLSIRVKIDTTKGELDETFELDTDGHNGYSTVAGVLQAVLEFAAQEFPESLREALDAMDILSSENTSISQPHEADVIDKISTDDQKGSNLV